jgi:hypothetical protein
VRAGGLRDRGEEVLERHLDQRCALHVVETDGVEADIDASRLLRHLVDVSLDGLRVVRVELRRLRGTARGGDLLGDPIELRQGATGEKDLRSLAGERARDRPAH